MMGYSPKSLEAITNNRQPLLEALAALHVLRWLFVMTVGVIRGMSVRSLYYLKALR
jgi:hypothetical protein